MKDIKIERDGGQWGAGLIRNFAVITRGDALGHGLWIDSEFLDQVVEFGNGKTGGFASHFTHPGLSSDGLGAKLGRVKNFQRTGDIVRGDIHFTKTSHETPDGDLSGYIMDLAAETPEDFGASITFSEDLGAMDRFFVDHTNKDGDFVSPDKQNANNYPHARLHELFAVDFVGEPAANPGGMFSSAGNAVPAAADSILQFALGLSSEQPNAIDNLPHPERVKRFWSDFSSRHGLKVMTRDAHNEFSKKLTEYAEKFEKQERKICALQSLVDRYEQTHTKGASK